MDQLPGVAPQIYLHPPGDANVFGEPVVVGERDGKPCLVLHPTEGSRSFRNWKGALDAFLALADIDRHPDRVVRFVRRWGRLGFCCHSSEENPLRYGLPFGYTWRCEVCVDARRKHWKDGHPWCWCDVCWPPEPLAAWIAVVDQVHAVLAIGSALRWSTSAVHVADVHTLYPGKPGYLEMQRAAGVGVTWDYAVERLNDWLNLGGVRVEAARNPKGHPVPLQLGLTSRSLLGNLALQLAAALTNESGLFTCAVCRRLVTDRQRAPRPGKVVLCAEHKRSKHNADNRAYNRRKAGAK